jgi:2-phospho-L-lactate guanylyltransferase
MLDPVQVLAVPVKPLERAKTRLATVLSAPERARLTLAMLEDVMDAATAQRGWDVWVVSADRAVLRTAARRGVRARLETAGSLLGAVRETESELGPEDVLAVLLADLPLLDAVGLAGGLRAAAEARVAAAPAASDGGTNLLVRRPAGAIPARFGRESLARHAAEAVRAGLPMRRIHEPGLAFDLDRPADLERVLAEGRAGRTLEACQELGLSRRLPQPVLTPDG